MSTRCLIASFIAALSLLAGDAHAQRSTPVQVTHPVGTARDPFGLAIAIDGDTMVVSASLDDVVVNVDQGSVHVYKWTDTGWGFEATLTASDAAAADRFGDSARDDVGAAADPTTAASTAETWSTSSRPGKQVGAERDARGEALLCLGLAALPSRGPEALFVPPPRSLPHTHRVKHAPRSSSSRVLRRAERARMFKQ